MPEKTPRKPEKPHNARARGRALRREAIKRLRAGQPVDLDTMPDDDVQALAHELEIHQVELEVQNEELRRTQVELATARDRYRHLYEYAPVGYLTLDAKGIVEQANLAAAALCGRNRSSMIGNRVETLVVRDDRDACYLLLQETGNEHVTTRELRLEHPDDVCVWVSADATIQPAATDGTDHFRVTLTEITDQKRTEEQLQAAQQRTTEILESITDAFYAVDADWRLTYINRRTETWWGRSRDELIGKVLWSFFPDHENTREYREHARAMTERKPVRFETFSPNLRIWADISIYPAADGGLTVYSRDISARKKAEQALRDANENLEQRVAQRAAESEARARHLQALAVELSKAEQRERDRLAHILHDDLQQYLAAARLPLGQLQTQLQDEKLGVVTARADDLVSTAIEMSQDLSRDLCPQVLTNDGLSSALEWVADNCSKKLGLQVHVDIEDDAEPTDKHVKYMLFSAVRELLFNVHKHAETDRASVTLGRSGDRLCLTVSDQGVGCKPAVAQSEEQSGGFGLFSIRERLIALGGSMAIDSEPGAGTRVTMQMPLQSEESEAPPSASADQEVSSAPARSKVEAASSTASAGIGIRILLAEDHNVIRESLASMLDGEPDMTVVGAVADGAEAVELAAQLQPDVVIMDVGLPRLDGIAATRRIRQKSSAPHVIALSMYDDSSIQRQMRDAGAAVYLAKSGPCDRLLAAIRELGTGD